MPPILPWLLAAAYWISGNYRPAVCELVLMLNAIAIWTMGVLIIQHAYRMRLLLPGYFLLIATLTANFHELFQKTSDTGWLLLIVMGTWWGAVKASESRSWKLWIAWGWWGGLVTLSSPVTGGAWIVVSLWACWNARSWQSVSFTGIACCCAFLVVTPWMVRNAIQFGKLIPIKSNGPFELWQSQCVDEDGVLDAETLKQHPFVGGRQFQLYRELGEASFMTTKASNVSSAIQSRPWDYLQKCCNRFAAANLWHTRISSLPKSRLLSGIRFWQQFLHVLPLVAFTLICIFKPRPWSIPLIVSILVWITALTPYLLISFTERYQVPLMGLKLIVILEAVQSAFFVFARIRLHLRSKAFKSANN